jgi:glycosyltransferase involved in cell wall biosynthesis
MQTYIHIDEEDRILDSGGLSVELLLDGGSEYRFSGSLSCIGDMGGADGHILLSIYSMRKNIANFTLYPRGDEEDSADDGSFTVSLTVPDGCDRVTLWFRSAISSATMVISKMIFFTKIPSGSKMLFHRCRESIFSDPGNMEPIFDEPVLYRYATDDLPIEILAHFKSDSDRLVVFGTSAIKRGLKLPIFQRHSMLEKFPFSAMIVHDPTLYIDSGLSVGWYQGRGDGKVLEDIAELIEILGIKIGIPSRRILFYGSSASGFFALQMASRLEGTIAFAVNPQTDILSYRTIFVSDTLQYCYGGMDEREVRSRHPESISILDRLEKIDFKPRIWYRQNLLDRFHLDRHLKPLIDKMRKDTIPEGLLVEYFSDGRGHNSNSSFDEIVKEIDSALTRFSDSRADSGASGATAPFSILASAGLKRVFSVESGKIYRLSFFAYSEEDEDIHNPALVSYDFDGRVLDSDELEINSLSLSDTAGYYSYFRVSRSGSLVEKYIFIPGGVERLETTMRIWNASSAVYISDRISLEEVDDDTQVSKMRHLLTVRKKSPTGNGIPIPSVETTLESVADIDAFVLSSLATSSIAEAKLYRILYNRFCTEDYGLAVHCAQKIIDAGRGDGAFFESLYRLHLENGKISRAFTSLPAGFEPKLDRIDKERISRIATRLSPEKTRRILDYAIDRFPSSEVALVKYAFIILKDIHREMAIEYGMRYISIHPEDIPFAKVLVKRMRMCGMRESLKSILRLVSMFGDEPEINSMLLRLEAEERLEKCEILCEYGREEESEKIISDLRREYSHKREDIEYLLYRHYRDRSYPKALDALVSSLRGDRDESRLRDLYDLHMRYGHIRRACGVIPREFTLPALKIKRKMGKSLLTLLERGFDTEVKPPVSDYRPIEGRVLYLLHNSLPYDSGGYASRTHGLLVASLGTHWKISGVTRTGYPGDRKSLEGEIPHRDYVDGVEYMRLFHERVSLGKVPMTEYLEGYIDSLVELAMRERPALIHAASNHMNGLVANRVAKALGIPSIYEVRGLWEITRISREPSWEKSDYFEMMVRLESQSAREADRVLVLTDALADEMVRRGVEREKIVVVPNGVDIGRFKAVERDGALEKELGLYGKTVIGYIGSIVQYEGLDYLVEAVGMMDEATKRKISVLIVGDGSSLSDLVDMVQERGLSSLFRFTGRVEHHMVERYHSLVDIAVLPRKGQPVCEMVSPLKPFEAMAQKKCIVASDVSALKEIIEDGERGILFQKDNPADLCEKLTTAIGDERYRKKLGESGWKWVTRERSWESLFSIVSSVYDDILGKNQS